MGVHKVSAYIVTAIAYGNIHIVVDRNGRSVPGKI